MAEPMTGRRYEKTELPGTEDKGYRQRLYEALVTAGIISPETTTLDEFMRMDPQEVRRLADQLEENREGEGDMSAPPKAPETAEPPGGQMNPDMSGLPGMRKGGRLPKAFFGMDLPETDEVQGGGDDTTTNNEEEEKSFGQKDWLAAAQGVMGIGESIGQQIGGARNVNTDFKGGHQMARNNKGIPSTLMRDGGRVKKGLYYYINKKRKEGRPMRKKGDPGAPTDEAFRKAALTAKKQGGGPLTEDPPGKKKDLSEYPPAMREVIRKRQAQLKSGNEEPESPGFIQAWKDHLNTPMQKYRRKEVESSIYSREALSDPIRRILTAMWMGKNPFSSDLDTAARKREAEILHGASKQFMDETAKKQDGGPLTEIPPGYRKQGPYVLNPQGQTDWYWTFRTSGIIEDDITPEQLQKTLENPVNKRSYMDRFINMHPEVSAGKTGANAIQPAPMARVDSSAVTPPPVKEPGEMNLDERLKGDPDFLKVWRDAEKGSTVVDPVTGKSYIKDLSGASGTITPPTTTQAPTNKTKAGTRLDLTTGQTQQRQLENNKYGGRFGEAIRKYRDGGGLPRYQPGGGLDPMATKQTTAPGVEQYTGPTHEQGGIPVNAMGKPEDNPENQIAEVEGGELLVKDPGGQSGTVVSNTHELAGEKLAAKLDKGLQAMDYDKTRVGRRGMELYEKAILDAQKKLNEEKEQEEMQAAMEDQMAEIPNNPMGMDQPPQGQDQMMQQIMANMPMGRHGMDIGKLFTARYGVNTGDLNPKLREGDDLWEYLDKQMKKTQTQKDIAEGLGYLAPAAYNTYNLIRGPEQEPAILPDYTRVASRLDDLKVSPEPQVQNILMQQNMADEAAREGARNTGQLQNRIRQNQLSTQQAISEVYQKTNLANQRANIQAANIEKSMADAVQKAEDTASDRNARARAKMQDFEAALTQIPEQYKNMSFRKAAIKEKLYESIRDSEMKIEELGRELEDRYGIKLIVDRRWIGSKANEVPINSISLDFPSEDVMGQYYKDRDSRGSNNQQPSSSSPPSTQNQNTNSVTPITPIQRRNLNVQTADPTDTPMDIYSVPPAGREANFPNWNSLPLATRKAIIDGQPVPGKTENNMPEKTGIYKSGEVIATLNDFPQAMVMHAQKTGWNEEITPDMQFPAGNDPRDEGEETNEGGASKLKWKRAAWLAKQLLAGNIAVVGNQYIWVK